MISWYVHFLYFHHCFDIFILRTIILLPVLIASLTPLNTTSTALRHHTLLCHIIFNLYVSNICTLHCSLFRTLMQEASTPAPQVSTVRVSLLTSRTERRISHPSTHRLRTSSLIFTIGAFTAVYYLVSLISKNNSLVYKSLLRMYCVWKLISALSHLLPLHYPILNAALVAWKPRDASVQSLNGHQQESSSTGESGEGKRRIHWRIVSLLLLMALWPWTRQLRG